jgi:hypothetical protein
MAPKARIHTNTVPRINTRNSHQNVLYCYVSIPGGGQNAIVGCFNVATESASRAAPATSETVKKNSVIEQPSNYRGRIWSVLAILSLIAISAVLIRKLKLNSGVQEIKGCKCAFDLHFYPQLLR